MSAQPEEEDLTPDFEGETEPLPDSSPAEAEDGES